MPDNQFNALKTMAVECGIASEPAVEVQSLNDYFASKFPTVAEKYGDAVSIKLKRNGLPYVAAISEDFFAAVLGEEGSPATPLVYLHEEGRFYKYSIEEGIYLETSPAKLATQLSGILLHAVGESGTGVDTANIRFRFRESARLKGVLERAKGVLERTADYFDQNAAEFIACGNGMLNLQSKRIEPFTPGHRRRNKLSVNFVPGASCPKFLDVLLKPALSADGINLLQRWCGLALVGVNFSQVILILTGTAGGGKGTLIRVLKGILGATNIVSLRTSLLTSRFELGRLTGRSLLYGADVPANFLNREGASVLKALTGGDPLTVEFKGSNARPEINGRFNAVVTCNSRLTVHLEGDIDAWRRRLRIVEYKSPPTGTVIHDLSERILREEGPGVLNWMIEGLDKLRADGWQLLATAEQQKRVDDLLRESESYVHFAKECLVLQPLQHLRVRDCYSRYLRFCGERGWTALSQREFGGVIEKVVMQRFSVHYRNDIPGEDGKAQRGWRGLACKD